MSVFTHWTEADEEAWERKHQAQKVAEEQAFQDRGRQPPRHSTVNDPDGRYWCATLDGVPVGSCTEFDVDEGWVQVYVIKARQPGETSTHRLLGYDQRRLHGRVEAVSCAYHAQLCREGPVIEITTAHLRGDPVPGTALHLPHWSEKDKAERRRIAAEVRSQR